MQRIRFSLRDLRALGVSGVSVSFSTLNVSLSRLKVWSTLNSYVSRALLFGATAPAWNWPVVRACIGMTKERADRVCDFLAEYMLELASV